MTQAEALAREEVEERCLALMQAICARNLLRVNCRMFSRVVEPHALGIDPLGQQILVAWQVSGGSPSGVPTGWKRFRVVEVIGICPLDESFTSGRIMEPTLLQDLRLLHDR